MRSLFRKAAPLIFEPYILFISERLTGEHVTLGTSRPKANAAQILYIFPAKVVHIEAKSIIDGSLPSLDPVLGIFSKLTMLFLRFNPYHTFRDSSTAFSSRSSWTYLSADSVVVVGTDPAQTRSSNLAVSLDFSSCWWYCRNWSMARFFSSSGRSSKVPWTRVLRRGEECLQNNANLQYQILFFRLFFVFLAYLKSTYSSGPIWSIENPACSK